MKKKNDQNAIVKRAVLVFILMFLVLLAALAFFTRSIVMREQLKASYTAETTVANVEAQLNRYLAEMIGRVGGYGVRIAEIHHTQKKDAPSGTAITLAEGVIAGLPAKTEWVNYAPGIEHAANRIGSPAEATPRQVVIDSVREGMVPGIHTVTYESEDDILELKHTIKNRRTLAMGAVIAAEFLCGKQGVYSMDDLLK